MRGRALDGTRMPAGTSVAERLAAHSQLDPSTGCLVWTGGTYPIHRYGRIGVARRQYAAHRLAWETENGPVPKGLVLRHSCDNPPCINVDHLSFGTQRDNVADMFARGRADRCGERSNSARLTWAAVRQLRADHGAGGTVRELAERFSISKSQVRNVINHTHWKEPIS